MAIRQKSREPSFWEVMDSFVLLAYASLAASRTLFQRLLGCLNFTLKSEDSSFWYKRKKVISMNYSSSTRSWKAWRWVKLDLIFSMRDIYISSNLNLLTKFTNSSRSTELKAKYINLGPTYFCCTETKLDLSLLHKFHKH